MLATHLALLLVSPQTHKTLDEYFCSLSAQEYLDLYGVPQLLSSIALKLISEKSSNMFTSLAKSCHPSNNLADSIDERIPSSFIGRARYLRTIHTKFIDKSDHLFSFSDWIQLIQFNFPLFADTITTILNPLIPLLPFSAEPTSFSQLWRVLVFSIMFFEVIPEFRFRPNYQIISVNSFSTLIKEKSIVLFKIISLLNDDDEFSASEWATSLCDVSISLCQVIGIQLPK
ncbi:hypothetical protein RCL1_001094 [Eukaryota sp. TZLM3-RCL]